MLRPLSLITLDQMIDLSASAWCIASGQTGTFVAPGGDDDVVKPTAGGFAVPIWTESNRDGTNGWTGDVTATGKLTVIYGKLRAVTDQYVGNPAVGDPLYVDTNGKLTVTSAGDAVMLGFCTKAPFSETYLSKVFTAIEYVSV